MNFILPAGEYFIGDPSYSFTNEDWDKANDLIFVGMNFSPAEKTLHFNGHPFCAISTQEGDGHFNDHQGRVYPVDTALLGAVSRAIVEQQDAHKDFIITEREPFGHWVTFHEPVECGYEAGVVYFGNITIDTRTQPDPEYDERDIDSEFEDDPED